MPVFRLTKQSIVALQESSFAQCGVKERGDLQRLLKGNITVVASGVLTIAASQSHDPYADWNGDGVADGDDPDGLDRILFEAALTLGCCP